MRLTRWLKGEPKTWIRWTPGNGLFAYDETYVTATVVKALARARQVDWTTVNERGLLMTESYHYRKRPIPSGIMFPRGVRS